jgi:M6 family metalloprotease-like protein
MPVDKDRPRQRIFPFDGVCTRKILRTRPPAPRHGYLTAAAAELDTVRVVALRIAFMTDRDDHLSSIRTGGDFDLTPDGTGPIDPTPHGRGFFDSHMTALRNYFWFQSCGACEVEWEVYPQGENDSYKLTDIADYGPGTSGTWTTARLVKFFRDAVEAADADVTFGDFDGIVVFHAGANLQSDINYDTPNDIPSFFARLGDEDAFYVDGGSTLITDGSVVPETATQDGYYGGIAAVLVHEFGHQIGLPDLYDIYYGMSSVGVWDIMDSGGFLGAYLPEELPGGEYAYRYVEGFLPSGMSAWSRTFLGWTEVDTLWAYGEEVDLPAATIWPSRIARIETGADEYFLVENRAAETDDILTGIIVDENGVVIGAGNCLNCGSGVPDDPEYELVNGYDMLLPTERDELEPDGGPGILVWHIDDRLIDERWEMNEVNSIQPFGVKMLEANGIVDLGNPASPFGLGWYDDAYFAGNNTALSDATLPTSWSSQGVPTGVRIEGIGPRDTVMSFRGGVDSLLAVRTDSVQVAGYGMLPLAGYASALLLDESGRGWLAGWPNPVFDAGGPVHTPAAWASDFTPGRNAVVVGDKDGTIHIIDDSNWTPFPSWPHYIGAYLATHPAIAVTEAGVSIAAADAAGRIHLLDSQAREAGGSPIDQPGTILGNLVIAGDADGLAHGIFTLSGSTSPSPNAWLAEWRITVVGGVRDSLSIVPGFPQRITLTENEIRGELALVGGDIDPGRSGDEVYIVSLETGRIILCGGEGVLMERSSGSPIASAPAAYDLNGDGFVELIYTDGDRVHAINPSGANLSGWPAAIGEYYELTRPSRFVTSPAVIRTESGARVAVGTDTGIIYIFTNRGEYLEGFPRKISSGFTSGIDFLAAVEGDIYMFRDSFQYTDSLLIEQEGGKRPGHVKWRRTPYKRYGGPGSWRSIWGSVHRTAFARPAGVTQAPGEWLSLQENCIVYPNPSNGERVGIHFTAPSNGSAHLEILTLTGDLILERDKRLAGGEDEFVISMTDRASGVYICRLVVQSGGQKVQALRKFAIVR